MKTVKDLIAEGSPLITKRRFYYKIGTIISYHLHSVMQLGPENFSIHQYYPDQKITYFRKVDDKSRTPYKVIDDMVYISKRGLHIDKLLDRPHLYEPFYSRMMSVSMQENKTK